jgi:hypothetical protein
MAAQLTGPRNAVRIANPQRPDAHRFDDLDAVFTPDA